VEITNYLVGGDKVFKQIEQIAKYGTSNRLTRLVFSNRVSLGDGRVMNAHHVPSDKNHSSFNSIKIENEYKKVIDEYEVFGAEHGSEIKIKNSDLTKNDVLAEIAQTAENEKIKWATIKIIHEQREQN
jgi:hypothetical protein